MKLKSFLDHIIVNAHSNGGRGVKHWARVKQELGAMGRDFKEVQTQSIAEAESAIQQAINSHVRCIVAAGGDGAVNLVVNELMKTVERERLSTLPVLGAIGLGSSNDFHKPICKSDRIRQVPVSLDITKKRRIDVGKVVYTGENGQEGARYFCLNGSVGVVADANHKFNQTFGIIERLKKWNVETAILYASLNTIFQYQGKDVEIEVDGESVVEPRMTNMSVLKKVHVAGGMKYDTPVTESDGWFDVALMKNMSKGKMLQTMVNLYRGQFKDSNIARCHRAKQIQIKSKKPINLEIDGEVFSITQAIFQIKPNAIEICGAGYGR